MDLFGHNRAEKRKRRSIAILQNQSIPYIEHLPPIPDKSMIFLKTREEIAKRVITSLITIQVAYEIWDGCEDLEDCRAFFREQLKIYDVADCLTKLETQFFTDMPAPQKVLNMIWRYEGCWVLLWALGMVKSLDFPRQICDCVAAIGLVTAHDSFASFCKEIQMRSADEVLDEADLIYRYHWACVDARINGRPMPGGMNEEVVVERHMALNWLIGDEWALDWDDIEVHT